MNIFDRLRIEKPDFVTKIKIIDGDLDQSLLGLSSDDPGWLIENVNFIFHCAATVRFNETLHTATKINIQGTNDILDLASMMKNLKGIVHVSTAYSHCPRNIIREEFYPTPITAKELKNMSIDEISRANILENWPNTYTFTKAITENMILNYDNQLPISIFRPSISKMLKIYSKTENTSDLLKEFTTREWSFDNENTKKLWLSLSKEDRNMFWFSLEKFDWKDYLNIYYFGIRKHILHEDLSNTKKAVLKNRK
ncbi:fatty acyl-CoA reductase wat-like [Aphis craccivora]|uniref:Fatty acyl-CoA reductase n=1 Tax=Aphis craccivora TaxID=307492 RepID=A0A6G0ZG78_APHCR|nr:fatty acyl-CoA reductase wat-like [Aphis craccivora]